ncbi:YcaO-like family protein [Lysinibacillus sp. NPDC093692]|uniref:YcaO-like family protein n=1 Tax=Lysinibacillus sp. NPDC093692 TaxID=3390578 RepID=UPI003D003890
MDRKATSNNLSSIYPFADPAVCNSKTGIVKDLFHWLPEPNDPSVFLMAAITNNSGRFANESATNFNSGAGLTMEAAYNAAVGEAIERYSSAFINEEELVLSSYRDLKENAIHPDKFAYYHEKQYVTPKFPFKKLNLDTVVNWVKGYSLIQNERVYIPAANVFLPYFHKNDEELIWHSVSTGLSCAKSKEEAILKGIFEVIERDCFSILWFNKLSMPKINIESDKVISDLFEQYFETPNCKFHLIDMTMDVKVPTVLGVLEDLSGGTLIAAATRLNLKDAVIKTLIELSQGRISWKRDFVEGVQDEFKEDFSDIRDFHSRVRLFTNKNMKKHIEFAYQSNNIVNINQAYPEYENSHKKQLSITLEMLKRQGYDVIIYDLTTNDVKKRGYHVIRVVIPGFTEITNDHVIPRAGGTRIYEVPKKINLKDTVMNFEELNPIPHPFP